MRRYAFALLLSTPDNPHRGPRPWLSPSSKAFSRDSPQHVSVTTYTMPEGKPEPYLVIPGR
jgi:hypothetical protein